MLAERPADGAEVLGDGRVPDRGKQWNFRQEILAMNAGVSPLSKLLMASGLDGEGELRRSLGQRFWSVTLNLLNPELE